MTEDTGRLTHHGAWAGLSCAGMVESTREIPGRTTTERRFSIASIGAGTKPFAADAASGVQRSAVRSGRYFMEKGVSGVGEKTGNVRGS